MFISKMYTPSSSPIQALYFNGKKGGLLYTARDGDEVYIHEYKIDGVYAHIPIYYIYMNLREGWSKIYKKKKYPNRFSIYFSVIQARRISITQSFQILYMYVAYNM